MIKDKNLLRTIYKYVTLSSVANFRLVKGIQ